MKVIYTFTELRSCATLSRKIAKHFCGEHSHMSDEEIFADLMTCPGIAVDYIAETLTVEVPEEKFVRVASVVTNHADEIISFALAVKNLFDACKSCLKKFIHELEEAAK